MRAVWQLLLHRVSGQDDLTVGSPVANRDRPEFDDIVGCFVNNVPFRSRTEPNQRFSDYLQMAYIPETGELTVFCSAIVGATLGFLWWNCHPADVFMGDTGSLSLGAALGTVAVLIRREFLLAIVCAVFVLEALSVMAQVLSFKLWGARVLRMAPLHHHFELSGWKESRVVVRFWIAAALAALVSLSTLKLQ